MRTVLAVGARSAAVLSGRRATTVAVPALLRIAATTTTSSPFQQAHRGMSSAAAAAAGGAAQPAAAVPASASAAAAAGAAASGSLLNAGLASFSTPREMYAHIRSLTSRHAVVRNYVGVVECMSGNDLVVETDLFPRDALEFYSKYNLNHLDVANNARDAELHERFYTPARGGGQGDYRSGVAAKLANVVSALRSFPNSKRAVFPVPHSEKPSSTADHTDTDEAKCLRELHFYLEPIADSAANPQQRRLCCTGFMRAQAASIFPKNIHFIGTVMEYVARELNVPVGSYTHIVTTLVDER
jgi:hypothetical protein